MTKDSVSGRFLFICHLHPVTWDEWITLPIRTDDNFVRPACCDVRVPAVIVAVNFVKVPKKRPKLCARAIRALALLSPGNHAVPRPDDAAG